MEKIYTIPVNEAFEESGTCPFCRLHQKLEENEIELILGASMMEPDTRIQTNEKGFCGTHFQQMLLAQKRLPLALMLESHLEEVHRRVATPMVSLKEKTGVVAERCQSVGETCYVCDRVEFHYQKMFETACLLWEADGEFRKKMASQRYFCLPCYTRFLKTAKLYISKKKLGDFLAEAQKVEMGYLESLRGDVTHFCRKFDYRYQKEPWGNAKDSVERAVRFLSGEILPSEKKESQGEEEEA